MINIVIGLMYANIILSMVGIVVSCKDKQYSELWVYAVVIGVCIYDIVSLSQ
jgi:hypothetical protein